MPSLRRPPLLALLVLTAPVLWAWDYEGHRIVNQLALGALPPEFPAFVREPGAVERVAFLSGEPDRWRNVPDLTMKHSGGSWTDHFCDLEYLTDAGLDLATLTSFRFDFVVQYAAGRAAHPDKFPPIDPAKNADHTREWPGFAPWSITEQFGRLRSGFSYLKVFEELGTPEEVANARANIIYVMGVMGHMVGDLSQPLHTTQHYNGWVGPNPKGYTTWSGLHAWVDGGMIAKAGIRAPQLQSRVEAPRALPLAARTDGRDPMFVAVMDYLMAQHRHVEPLYQLEKNGDLGHGDQVLGAVGRGFIEQRLLEGGHMLASIWYTAWRSAVPDTYLRSALIRRQMGVAPGKAKGKAAAQP